MEEEFALFLPDHLHPINAKAVLRRLYEILENNKTNSFLNLHGVELSRARACIILLSEIAKMGDDLEAERIKAKNALKSIENS